MLYNNLKQQVFSILKKHKDARNSDIALIGRIAGLSGETLKNFKLVFRDLSFSTIIRRRQEIQSDPNSGVLPSPKVLAFRRKQEEDLHRYYSKK
jgi:hypothetical protein